MKRRRKRKCLHCREFYLPDARTHGRRRFCSAPDCKRASKAWRQRRWLHKPENRKYFGDEKNITRVQDWRQAHPGYWRRRQPKGETALQDDSAAQPVGVQRDSSELVRFALQDGSLMQPAVVVGVISNLTGTALQDDIVVTLRELHARGQSILGAGPGMSPKGDHDEDQTAVVSGAPTDDPGPVQPGRPPPGAR